MIGVLLGLALIAGAWLGWPAVVAIAGVPVVGLLTGGRQKLWLLGLLAFAAIGAGRVYNRPHLTTPDWATGPVELTGKVVSGPVEGGRTQRFEVEVQSLSNTTSVRFCAIAPLLPIAGAGDYVWFKGNATGLSELDGSDAGYLHSRGCAANLDIQRFTIRQPGRGISAYLDRIRRTITGTLQASSPGDTGALMAGLVTGDDASLSYEKRRAFIVTGTSHITAVSGSNLAVVLSFLMLMGRVSRRGTTIWWQVIVVASLWLYVAVIGFSPPPLRAALVATIAVGALRLGRRPDFVTLSLVAAVIELTVRPADFESLAFRLSTISAIALVLGLSQRSPKGVRGWFAHIVLGTAVTQAATSLLLIPLFGQITLYAIPANLVVATLCSLAFPLALLAGVTGLFSQPLAEALSGLAVLPVQLALRSVSLLARLPYSDSGTTVAMLLPAWGWGALCITVVVAMSRDCRDILKWAIQDLMDMDSLSRTLYAVSAGSTSAGMILALWLR